MAQGILRRLGLPGEVPGPLPARAPPPRLETLEDPSRQLARIGCGLVKVSGPARRGVGAACRFCFPRAISLSYSRVFGDNRPQTGASPAPS